MLGACRVAGRAWRLVRALGLGRPGLGAGALTITGVRGALRAMRAAGPRATSFDGVNTANSGPSATRQDGTGADRAVAGATHR